MTKQAHQRILYFTVLSLLILFTWSQIKPLGVFYSNQHTYFLQGMRMAGVEYLQNDPDALQQPWHVALTFIVYVFQKLNKLAIGSQIIEAGLIALFCISIFLVSEGFCRVLLDRYKNRSYKDHTLVVIAFIATAIFLFFLDRYPIFKAEGLAGMSVLSRYMQASEFGIFVILGFGFILRKWWFPATCCFAFASIMHSSFLFPCALFMLVLGYELYRSDQAILAIRLVLFFGLINLPFFIIGPLRWTLQNDAEAVYIFNVIRSSHHTVVSRWWSPLQAYKLLVMMIAAVLIGINSSKVFRSIFFSAVIFIIVGIVLEYFTNSSLIHSIIPWRISAQLLPASYIIIITFVLVLIGHAFSEKLWHIIASLASVFLVAYISQSSPFDWPRALNPFSSPETRMIKDFTNQDQIILVPPKFDYRARIYSERAIFVSWKTNGFDIQEWFDHINFAEKFVNASYQRQMQLCREEHFDYYLLPKDAPSVIDTPIIAETEDYILGRCPQD